MTQWMRNRPFPTENLSGHDKAVLRAIQNHLEAHVYFKILALQGDGYTHGSRPHEAYYLNALMLQYGDIMLYGGTVSLDHAIRSHREIAWETHEERDYLLMRLKQLKRNKIKIDQRFLMARLSDMVAMLAFAPGGVSVFGLSYGWNPKSTD